MVYQKKLKNISFSIRLYENKKQLDKIISDVDLSGKLFIGPLNSLDSNSLEKFCSQGAVFFSFSSTGSLPINPNDDCSIYT